MYSTSTKNVPQVMEEIGEIVGSLNKLCTTKERIVKEVVQIIPRADVPVVL